MKLKCSHATQTRLWLLGCAVALASLTGCQFLSDRERDPAVPLAPPAAAANGPAAHPHDEPAAANEFADEHWIAAIPDKGTAAARGWRWRNLALEQWELKYADQQDQKRETLARAVRDKSSVVAANAAILLGRASDPQAMAPLLKAIEDPTLKQPLRRAAAEALGALPPKKGVLALHTALRAIERKIGLAQPAYNFDLNAELLTTLAELRTADEEPEFTRALEKSEPQARVVALERWAQPGETPLPAKALDLCQDADPRVRLAAVHALMARPSTFGEDPLLRASRDPKLEVKLAAIAALGKLHSDQARQALEQLLVRDGELVRAAAATALIEAGSPTAIFTAGADKSWRVRIAAAAGLATFQADYPLALVKKLLQDPSGDVERAAIAAIASWPLATAGPLWLAELDSSAYASRKAAAIQLAEQWPPAKDYSADAPAERRAARVIELRQKWGDQFGAAIGSPPSAAHREPAAAQIKAPELDSTLRQAISRLDSPDLAERREAVQQITQAAARQPLHDDVLAACVQKIIPSQDPTVWQAIFSALAEDRRPAVVDLACAGLSHPSADVRRRACEVLAAAGRAENAPALVASLSDAQIAVQIAAAKALGRIGTAREAKPLAELLSSSDRTVRVTAATSLLRLQPAEAAAALERLTYDRDERIRRQAAEAMGQSDNAEFVPTLIRLLDDRPSVQLAAVAGLDQLLGHDTLPPAEPDAASETADRRARRWKAWHAAQQDKQP
ncbi:MAG TPA: HEAT repeat domain-containing protein [Pirellulales bacterium]|nr:HEAT repeat domain-containing protein [Pirellulales bacterium]